MRSPVDPLSDGVQAVRLLSIGDEIPRARRQDASLPRDATRQQLNAVQYRPEEKPQSGTARVDRRTIGSPAH